MNPHVKALVDTWNNTYNSGADWGGYEDDAYAFLLALEELCRLVGEEYPTNIYTPAQAKRMWIDDDECCCDTENNDVKEESFRLMGFYVRHKCNGGEPCTHYVIFSDDTCGTCSAQWVIHMYNKKGIDLPKYLEHML